MGAEFQAKGKNTKGNAIILIGALLVFGMVFTGFGAYKYKLGKASVSWPTVTGKVTQSRVQSKRSDGERQYRASVNYAFAVDGTDYTGNRITASDVYQKRRSRAQSILSNYPAGSEVTVYYDPAHPGTALLEPGIQGNVYYILAAGIGCFLVAAGMLVSAIQKGFASESY